MASILRSTLRDPGIPESAKDPAGWPPLMRSEWGDDDGASAAAAHRAALVQNLRNVRTHLEEFDPDFIIIFGDDQYENFREDLIPPFAVLAYEDMTVTPWTATAASAMTANRPNVWDEPATTTRLVRGHPRGALWLAERLLAAGVDVSYAYKPLHHNGLSHAFLNAILYLDYDREGFDWPVVAFHVNCYGSSTVAARGFMTRFGDATSSDPPSPSPARLLTLGAETVRALLESEWRVALVASSSWSHAFLCDHTWRLRPDTEADRRLYDALTARDWPVWEQLTVADLEYAGQHELLNWFPVIGAARFSGATLGWSTFVQSDCFNSNKVFAVWDPVVAPVATATK